MYILDSMLSYAYLHILILTTEYDKSYCVTLLLNRIQNVFHPPDLLALH